MAKRQLSDVHPGHVWRDRDPRMSSGNRLVKVEAVVREGDRWTVHYKSFYGNIKQVYKSRYDRFQRAFDLVPEVR